MNFLSDISKLTDGVTHLITAENVYGEKGRGGMARIGPIPQEEVVRIGQVWSVDHEKHPARDLGEKYKIRPCIMLAERSVTTVMDVAGAGAITHIWFTTGDKGYRDLILRVYWDGEGAPSVECPLGDFFGCPFTTRLKILSLPINVNPQGGMNCYFPMPFRRGARMTIENRDTKEVCLFYAISYEERPIAEDEAYFHAQFRRENPLKYGRDFTILDGVKGRGHYVGTQMGWQQNTEGWWGEGEIKMFIDGDVEYATYVGTGTEDYFGGAWGFGDNFTAPFLGYQDLMNPAGHGGVTNRVGHRHSMYRFHLPDPIRFSADLKVTMQALGWRVGGRFLPVRDDLCSVAYWYQTEPHAAFPSIGDRDALEVI